MTWAACLLLVCFILAPIFVFWAAPKWPKKPKVIKRKGNFYDA